LLGDPAVCSQHGGDKLLRDECWHDSLVFACKEVERKAREPLEREVQKLADFIMYLDIGEPSQSVGAVDCAITIMTRLLAERSDWERAVSQAGGGG